MIYNDTITRAYFRYKGTAPSRGMRMDLSPVVHFFLMDCVRELYSTAFKDLPMEGMAAKKRNSWGEALSKFDYRFWVPFKGKGKEELQNYLIDKLDDYQKYIAHDLFIARIAWEEIDNDMPREQQEISSALWLSNNLAAGAQGAHYVTFRTPKGQKMCDHDIDVVLKSTQDLCLMLYPDGRVSEKHFKRINDASNVIINKTHLWLKKDAEEENARVREDYKGRTAPTRESLEALKDRYAAV